MKSKRFLMNAGRTTKQGQQINVGKDSPEYQAITTTIIMNPDDMKEAGIASGTTVRVRSDNGEALFQCKDGKVPPGMIIVPYGPPTCRLMGQTNRPTGRVDGPHVDRKSNKMPERGLLNLCSFHDLRGQLSSRATRLAFLEEQSTCKYATAV